MKSLFRKILFGDTEIKEYSTVTIAGEIKENVFLETGKFTIDISKIHWVLCLEPIVFGVWLKKDGHTIDPGEKQDAGCISAILPVMILKLQKEMQWQLLLLTILIKLKKLMEHYTC